MKTTFAALVLTATLTGCPGPEGEEGASLTVAASTSTEGRAARETQTPQEFGAAIVKAELLRGADDSDPGVIFDAEDGDADAAIIDLTEEALTIYNGNISAQYLGTYTHARLTVAAGSQLIGYTDAAGSPQTQTFAEFYQDVDNSDGGYDLLPTGQIELGDVLLEDGGDFVWFQIDETGAFSSSDDRDGVTAYQDASPGEAVQLIELSESFVIEAGGSYTLHATFELTDTFSYDDVDADGAFEPLSDDHDGTMNGIDFGILVPGLSITTSDAAAD